MYSLIDYSFSSLLLLPIEMLVTILRFLDDKSLLNTAFANKRFMSVCKGDPVLRRRVRSYIREQKQLYKKATVDAKLGMEITRGDLPQLFGRNQKKLVTVRNLNILRPTVTVVAPEARSFTLSKSDNRPSGGGKVIKKSKNRAVPYNVIRL